MSFYSATGEFYNEKTFSNFLGNPTIYDKSMIRGDHNKKKYRNCSGEGSKRNESNKSEIEKFDNNNDSTNVENYTNLCNTFMRNKCKELNKKCAQVGPTIAKCL